MKKLISSSVILFASAFFIANTLQAQSSPTQPSFRNASVDLSSGEGSAIGASTVNKKALKSFGRTYRTSAAVKWFDSGDMIQAYFVENGKQNRVFYNPKGNWTRTIITYDESLLNNAVKSLVKSHYKKYDITCVIEVHEGNMDCYFINIETAKNFKQVIVYEDEVFVHQEFTKQ